MTTITFSHHKGGTGKTTSCLNIAGFCALAGRRVLVVDCDPQANATAGLGISPERAGRNMYDVFMSTCEGFPAAKISDIIRTTGSGIDVAPSHLDLAGADPYLYRMENRAGVLKKALEEVGRRYDYILIDTPPSLGQLVINGLYAADHIIVTLDSGSFALDGVITLSTIFRDMKDDLKKEVLPDLAIISRWGEGNEPAGIKHENTRKDLITRIRDLLFRKPGPTPEEIRTIEEQKNEHERLLAMLAEAKRRFPVVFTVPFSPLVYEAQQRGLPISHYAPESSAGAAYKAIADEVMRWS